MQFLPLRLWILGLVLVASLGSLAYATPQLRLHFIENRGQLRDSEGHLRPDLRYMVQTPAGAVYLRTTGLSYVFARTENQTDRERLRSLRADIEWIGANPAPVIRAEGKPGATIRYYTSNEFIETRGYERIIYQNLYPNIDLVYYTSGQGLKYDFVVHPGGDPAQIRLQYKGFGQVKLTRSGRLVSETKLGQLEEEAPVSFVQAGGQQLPVSSQYALRNGTLTFKVGSYDASQTLVIDPLTRLWATNYGGSAFDRIQAVAFDNNQRVNVTGTTTALNFPVSLGAVQTSFAGQQDAFVAQFDANGSLNWATYYGGSGVDQGLGIGFANGQVTVVGYTTSTNFPVANALIRTTAGGSGDGFIVQFASNGTRNWATYFGGSANDYLAGVSVASNGEAVIVGRTFSTGLATTGAAQAVLGGNRDAVLLRINPNGALIWCTYFGGDSDDQGMAVTFAPNGDVLVTGLTNSDNLPTTAGVVQPSRPGGTDSWVARYTAAGARLWSTYLGGSGSDAAQAITSDDTGNAWVTGFTGSTNFPTQNSIQGTNGGLNDAFVTGLSTSGQNFLFSTYLGGNGTDQAFGIARFQNNLYISGASNSTNFQLVNPNAVNLPFQTSNNGFLDLFLTKINLGTNSRVWSILYGGARDDAARALAATSAGLIAIGGYSNSPNVPLFNALPNQPAPGLANDDALLILLEDVPEVICTPLTITPLLLNPTCFDDTDGEIAVIEPAGPQFRYSLIGTENRPEQASQQFTNLRAGTYTVRVNNTAVPNCFFTLANQVLVNPEVIRPVASATPFDCGQANGSISVVTTGGTPPYRFTLKSPSGTVLVDRSPVPNFQNLSVAGIYTIEVTDSSGCSSTVTADVRQNIPFVVTAVGSPTTCGLQNGVVVVTTPIPGATYELLEASTLQLILDPQPNVRFDGVPANTYYVRVTDPLGCSAFTDPLLIGGSSNTLRIQSVTPGTVECNGSTTTVAIQLQGGLAPFSYTLLVGSTAINGVSPLPFFTVNNVPAGRFSLTVTDQNGCSAPNSFSGTISQPTPVVGLNPVFQQSNCATGQQAEARIQPSGGTPPYVVSLNGGPFTSQTIYRIADGLQVGLNTLRIRDANGCLSPEYSGTINPSNEVVIQQAVSNPTLCNGQTNGSIDVFISGGQAPYTYFLNGVQQGPAGPELNRTFTDLPAGTYTVLILDGNGCFGGPRDVVVNDAPLLRVVSVTGRAPSFCGGLDGSLTINAAGGTGELNYQIRESSFESPFQSDPEFLALPTNFYTVVVVDANECRAETTYALNDNGAPEILNVSFTNPLCANDPNLNATGQIIISTTLPVNPVYYSINNLLGPFVSSTTGSYTFTNLTAGTYPVVVSTTNDLLGCRAFYGPVRLAAPAPITVSLESIRQPICGANPQPGSITLAATGGTGQLFFGIRDEGFSSNPTLSGLYPRPGGIPVQVRDQNGCTVNGGNIFLFNPSGLTMPAPIVTGPTCGGGMGRIRVTPTSGTLPRQYFLNGVLQATNSNTFYEYTNLMGGIYDVEVRDATGCRVQTRVVMADVAAVTISTNPPTCGQANGSIVLEMSGIGPYRYSFTGRAYTANILNGPQIVSGGPVTGQSSPITIPNLRPGVYDVEIRDESDPAACVLTRTVRLFNTGGPSIVALFSQDRTCNIVNGPGQGGSITVFTNGEVQQVAVASTAVSSVRQVAIGPATTFTTVVDQSGDPLPAGDYNVFVVGQNNCISDGGSRTITQPPLIRITAVNVNQPTCESGGTNGRITVIAEGGRTLEYTIDNGTTWQSSNVFDNLNSSVNPIRVRVREAGDSNCFFEWPFPITLTTQSGLRITGNPVVTQPRCNGESNGSIAVTIAGGVGPFRYLINGETFATTSASNFTYSGLRSGSYLIRVEDSRNCGDERSIFVDQPAPVVPAVGTFVRPTVCRGGEITTLTATGGDGGPYFFSLYDTPIVPYNPPPFTDLSIGTYRIYATDNRGCRGSILYNLTGTGVPRLAINSFSGRDVTCFGADNGELRIEIYAPQADLAAGFVTYTLNNTPPPDPNLVPPPVPASPGPLQIVGTVPPTGEIIMTNVPPGTYTLRVRNFSPTNPCATRAGLFVIRINQPNPIIIDNVLVQQPNCTSRKTGRIEVITVPDPTRTLEYSVDNGLTWQRSNVFEGLRPTDINLVDPLPPLPRITLYNISVRDANTPSCVVEWSQRINIVNPGGLNLVSQQIIDPSDVRNETCPGANDGTITYRLYDLTTNDASRLPIRYFLNGNLVHQRSQFTNLDHTVTGLAPGNYTLRVTDNQGCEDELALSVGTDQGFTVEVQPTNPNTTTANSGRIRVTVSGGRANELRQAVLFRNGVQVAVRALGFGPVQATANFPNLDNAFYQVVVRYGPPANATCAETLNVALCNQQIPVIPRVNVTPASNAVCSNGSAEIVTQGGGPNLQFALIPASQSIETIAANQYQSQRLFPVVPAGNYTAVVRSGVQAPFCFNSFPVTVGCTAPKLSEPAPLASGLFAVQVYPNPNRGQFVVRFSTDGADEPVVITVLDLNGRRLIERRIQALIGEQELPLHLDGAASGLYLVRIQQGQTSQSIKVVVE
jgi:hypothetical protein